MATVQELHDRAVKLPTSDKLRLAAELLDRGDLVTAEVIAQRAVDEMAAGRTIRKPKGQR